MQLLRLEDEEITIEGQKITVEKVEVYPTCTAVTVKLDDENTVEITEAGMMMKSIKPEKTDDEYWLTGEKDQISDGRIVFYGESNYFSDIDFKELIISSLSGVKKGERDVTVDLKAKKVTFMLLNSGNYDGSEISEEDPIVNKYRDGSLNVEYYKTDDSKVHIRQLRTMNLLPEKDIVIKMAEPQ